MSMIGVMSVSGEFASSGRSFISIPSLDELCGTGTVARHRSGKPTGKSARPTTFNGRLRRHLMHAAKHHACGAAGTEANTPPPTGLVTIVGLPML